MNKQLSLVKAFHKKFRGPIAEAPTTIPQDRIALRYTLMREEVEEYRVGAEKGDLENVAKELADILYAVYGTILEHGLEDKMEAIFEEVHNSQMTKDYAQYKMVKGKNYKEANIKKFFEKEAKQ
ncbi:MAG TPA: nucleoside triphosphate pyrophosphohydrolase family protein [Candidatus Saccharimonadales bacterium]|nr:nucleoside triphosphate pyrophosphohydrolase family protein [Candidatus Saccharimonadales bacterium]